MFTECNVVDKIDGQLLQDVDRVVLGVGQDQGLRPGLPDGGDASEVAERVQELPRFQAQNLQSQIILSLQCQWSNSYQILPGYTAKRPFLQVKIS